jgi:GMP synthase-like glutamine amidotransferase
VVAGALYAAALAARAMQQRRRRVRLAVLNPRQAGDVYNSAVMPMMREMFLAMKANVVLVEIDVGAGALPEQRTGTGDGWLNAFDGFIIPGSAAAAYDTTTPWVAALAETVKTLDARRRPTLGICFGHQIIAHALGGHVERNRSHGIHAASCGFELTPLGSHLLRAETSDAATTTAATKPTARHAQYHHNDVVTRLPTRAANLGCSATNPVHAAAVFASAAVARTAITRASVPASSAPHAVTFQAHPEFSTPTGRKVLLALLNDPNETPPQSLVWMKERLASVDDPVANGEALELAEAAARLLWPVAFAYT